MSSESTIEKDSNESRAAEAAEAEAAAEEARDDKDDAEDREDAADADDRDDEAEDEGDDDEARESGARAAPEPEGPKEKVVLDRPSSAKMVWILARREISSYFHSAISYIVIAASLVVLGLYFFFYKGGFWQVDRATMTRMFEIVPAALCFLTVPLFTMRSLSDEKRVGTIELLITMPVKDSEVVLGKFFGSLVMVSVQVGLLVFYPLVMFTRAPAWHLGELDWNPFWVGMFGLLLLSAAATAIGLMWSSMSDSQILSYFATALTLLALYGIGSVSVVEYLQGWPGDAISFISLQTRFEPFARGILDTRNIVYFLSVAVLGLVVAFRQLESRKWT